MNRSDYNRQFNYQVNRKDCTKCKHVRVYDSQEITDYKIGTDIPAGFTTVRTYKCDEMAGLGIPDNEVYPGGYCDCCR